MSDSAVISDTTVMENARELPQIYRPLDHSKNEIRLLKFLPSTDKAAVIYCELETTTLDAQPSYKSLSYELNPPETPDTSSRVLINGQEVETAPNLRHALARLGDWPSERYWIDTLCINQSDKQERRHQVQTMRRIYQQAIQVIVWLGLDRGEMLLGMDLITELADYDKVQRQIKQDRQDLWLRKLADPSYRMHWEGIIQILKNSYWSRLWIVQEIVVAGTEGVSLLCDSKSIPFTHIRVLTKDMLGIFYLPAIESKAELAYRVNHSGWKTHNIGLHRDKFLKDKKDSTYDMSLLGNLVRYHEQSCKDPRDKVYAILGMSRGSSDIEFPISYTDSVPEVFCNLAKYIIEDSRRLDILLECHWEHRDPKNPSWVPNWQKYERQGRTIYYKTKNWEASTPFSAEGTLSFDNKILKARGFILGQILQFSDIFDIYNLAESFRDWLTFVISTLTSQAPAPKSKRTLWHRLKSLLHIFKFSHKAKNASTYDTHVLESSIQAFFDALVKTALKEGVYGFASFYNKFRAYCKKVVYDTELPEEEEWPFSHPHDPTEFAQGRRLCFIEFSGFLNSSSLASETPSTVGISDFDSPQGVGLCPDYAMYMDTIAVIRGCRYPVVLRQVENGYQIISSLYVYGFMEGEALSRFPEVDINLV